MAPTYEHDGAEERFKSSEWINYELWERIQVRIRKKKLLWIFLAFLLFILLSSIPIMIDRWPKWVSIRAARELASTLNQVKTLAAAEGKAARLRFLTGADGTLLDYVIEESTTCQSTQWKEHVKGQLLSAKYRGGYTVLTPEQGLTLNIPRLITAFCYESISEPLIGPMSGFAVTSVKDLTSLRVDRSSVVLLSGTYAEISFD